jgi:hypothetical protein
MLPSDNSSAQICEKNIFCSLKNVRTRFCNTFLHKCIFEIISTQVTDMTCPKHGLHFSDFGQFQTPRMISFSFCSMNS